MDNDTQKLEKTTPCVPNKEEDDERQTSVSTTSGHNTVFSEDVFYGAFSPFV